MSRKLTREFQNFRFRRGVLSLSHLEPWRCAVFLKRSWECISVWVVKAVSSSSLHMEHHKVVRSYSSILASHFFLWTPYSNHTELFSMPRIIKILIYLFAFAHAFSLSWQVLPSLLCLQTPILSSRRNSDGTSSAQSHSNTEHTFLCAPPSSVQTAYGILSRVVIYVSLQ